jgi:phytoene dehydrogenase-like protein
LATGPPDATVVGAGPNGLAAAVELARSGRRVLVVEAAEEIGGGTRTEELTLPGFLHDVCSAIHPSGVASPFFRRIDLAVDWIQPPLPLAHPLDGGRAVGLHGSVRDTAAQFGEDESSYVDLMGPLVETFDAVIEEVLGPLTLVPEHLGPLARFAIMGGLSASTVAARFDSDEARALFGGLAAHAIAPFDALATAGVGLMLAAVGHALGWPLARGGSQSIAAALAEQLRSHGGSIETGRLVETVDELDGDLFLLDVMPPAAYQMAKDRLSLSALWRLPRWNPGPGVFKVDWALGGPIPWADPVSPHTATVHLGGTWDEVKEAEDEVFKGRHPERPFVILAQQSLFDPTRAPEGQHTAWGYCHVPNGSTVDMTAAIEAQIERFAPGFTDLVLERHTRNSLEYESYNPNFVGGDIGGGKYGLRKVLKLGSKRPYTLGAGVYLCSAAAPPGAGVHGMCGYYAARAALDSD